MRFENKYLINENLVEIPASKLLVSKIDQQKEFLRAKVQAVTGEVPLVSTDAITPGLLYPSSTEGQPDFYLPKYVARSVDGVGTTRLEMFPPSEDPTAPAGRLTVEVQAIPQRSDKPLRTMPHDVSLRLGYRIPLEDDATEPVPASLAGLTGGWTNSDPDTEGVVTLSIAHAGGNRLKLQARQNGLPKPTDLGTVMAEMRNGQAVALFRGEDRTVSLTLRLAQNMLLVTELSDIHDPAAPGDFTATHAFFRDGDASDLPFIWIDLEAAAAVGSTVRRSVTTIPDMETYIRLHRVLTRPEHHARLEVLATAKVGRRSIKQVFVGHKTREALVQHTGTKVFYMDKTSARKIRKDASHTILERPDALNRPTLELMIDKPLTARPAQPVRPVQPMQPHVVATAERGRPATHLRVPFPDAIAQPAAPRVAAARARGRDNPFARAAELARRFREAREAAERAADVVETHRAAFETERLAVALSAAAMNQIVATKLPQWVVVEDNGKPVLTRRTAQRSQIISPFWMDPALYADRLDAPEDTPGGLVLLRHEVTSSGQSAIFYQDGLTPRQIYYEPQEFRLVRSDTAPFAPLMHFVLSEEIDEDAPEGEEAGYSVSMSCHARPFIDPALFEAARSQFGEECMIAPITASASSLTLRLPSNDADGPIEITRDDADISFQNGLSETLTLSETEFRHLTAAFQTSSGVGLSGHVTVTFPDGRKGEVPVRIGLRDAIGDVFNASIGPDGLGLALINRIESPARIESLPVIDLPDGGKAVPQDAPPADFVAPRERVDVTYRTDPPGKTLDAPPRVTDVSVEPDMQAILAQTVEVQGYASDTFDITVSVDPMFFEFVPEGAEPLTGLSVSFRTREEPVVLTRETPSQTVTLQMPHLLFLTNAAEAQHYAYEVQDLHASGPGAVTAYRAGSGNLEVQPALAEVM